MVGTRTVPFTLRKHDIILSKINARIRKTTHKKYGIEIPTSVAPALQNDRVNNNTFWKDALAKGMTMVVGVAFEVLEESIRAPIGWSKVTGHLVWDVKMEFTCKARHGSSSMATRHTWTHLCWGGI